MQIKSSEEILNEVLVAGASKEDIGAGLDRIVSDVSGRISAAIEKGVEGLELAALNKVQRLESCWQPLASKGLQPILSSKSAAPGLSHHGIYIEELKAAYEASESIDDFQQRLDTLKSKWGSMAKYPLFAKGRRKQLVELDEGIRAALPRERRRAGERAEKLLLSELDTVRETTREEIGHGAADFEDLLSAVFRRPSSPEFLIHLRWLLIGLLQKRLFAQLNEWLGEDQGEYRDFLYTAFEKVLNKVYQSFRTFVRQASGIGQAGVAGLAGANLATTIKLEIQRTNQMIASLQTMLTSMKMSSGISNLIRSRLRGGDFSVAADPDLFINISSGLRADFTFEQFVEHLRSLSDLDPQFREEILAYIKNRIEPFRSLYYAKINHVRYFKGLSNFQSSVPG